MTIAHMRDDLLPYFLEHSASKKIATSHLGRNSVRFP